MTVAFSRSALRLGTLAVFAGTAIPTAAQQPMSEVLSFLLTNRSIATGDFTRDELAAAATRDTISRLLLAELSILPVTSPAGGFTYRLDPSLGSDVRSSDSFGPFFLQRSLTVGRRQASFGVSYQRAAFDKMDGRSLRDGTLVATASHLRGDEQAFDLETVSLRIDTHTITVSGSYGITDRIDVSAAAPIVFLALSGERVDTYRSQRFLQATVDASAFGVGDTVFGAKYNYLRHGGSGLALAGEVRLPTGDPDNLLGAGRAAVVPQLVGSFDRNRVAIHGELGYALRGLSEGLHYSAAVTVVGASRLTASGEIVGRRLTSGGHLAYSIDRHPQLVGVDTIRLIGTDESTTRLIAVVGFRWNVSGRWLINATVLRPLTTAGLTSRWVPGVTIDYSLGR